MADNRQGSTPQEEKDLLLRAVTSLAQKLLQRGPFAPFAATLGSKRDAQVLMSTDTDWETVPSRKDLEEYWTPELRQAIVQGESRAACYCALVRIQSPEGKIGPGVVIHIEHVESGAEEILYPCRRDETSKIVLGEPVNAAARRHLFSS